MPEWVLDRQKDLRNRRRHGLSLASGIPALEDPLALSRPDPHPDGDRWQTVGSAASVVTLFVVCTDPGSMPDGRQEGRIISVRKASAYERKAYESGDF
ncbi:BrnT family toxin [Rhodopila sp.]|uniref:BrnT family toxin n=1 Tax=Rhodopila sp. TaxID=2480087 RepID=UPI003D0A013E